MKAVTSILLAIAVAGVLLTSCKVRTPKGVISTGKMENILYDYHAAQSIAKDAGNSDYYAEVYTEAVLQKHGVTREEFNASMEYYSKHADLLYDIYEKLGKRFQNEVQAMGGSIESASVNYAALTSQGDTANIWTGKNYALLIPKPGKNLLKFHINADSTFRLKDRFEWRLSTKFIYKEGKKTAQMAIAIRYDNDSVVSVKQSIYGEGENVLTIPSSSKLTIKELDGFIYIDEPWNETVKLMFISGMSLIRYHAQPEPKAPELTPADSTANAEEAAKKAFIDSIQQTSKAGNDTSDHFRATTRGRAIPHQKRPLIK